MNGVRKFEQPIVIGYAVPAVTSSPTMTFLTVIPGNVTVTRTSVEDWKGSSAVVAEAKVFVPLATCEAVTARSAPPTEMAIDGEEVFAVPAIVAVTEHDVPKTPVPAFAACKPILVINAPEVGAIVALPNVVNVFASFPGAPPDDVVVPPATPTGKFTTAPVK